MADPGWHLEQSWPGLQAQRDGVTYSASTLTKIAEELQTLMNSLSGSTASGQPSPSGGVPGSLPHLQSDGNLTYLATNMFGAREADAPELKLQGDTLRDWAGGRTFGQALISGHNEMSTIYQQVIEKLQVAIALVQEGAANYKGANQANES